MPPFNFFLSGEANKGGPNQKAAERQEKGGSRRGEPRSNRAAEKT